MLLVGVFFFFLGNQVKLQLNLADMMNGCVVLCVALTCGVFFAGSFAETEHREVTFPEISTVILEKICQYFYWSLQYAR